ncbi:MAG: hypothetical protein FJ143_03330 [Deltaproteobacteria bacterium]|nr:hypothetical protein [Deltaproteobacteria bacterium]
MTRPAIANERIKRNRAGQVVLQLKSPYKDGTANVVMEPVEFMDRSAARAGSSSRSVPDHLSSQNSLPTQAHGDARSELDRASPQGTFRASPGRFPAEPTATPVGFSSGTNRIDISCGPALWLWVIEKRV